MKISASGGKIIMERRKEIFSSCIKKYNDALCIIVLYYIESYGRLIYHIIWQTGLSYHIIQHIFTLPKP